jgi:hypothetical protein
LENTEWIEFAKWKAMCQLCEDCKKCDKKKQQRGFLPADDFAEELPRIFYLVMRDLSF